MAEEAISPAAFGRLCVETTENTIVCNWCFPAAFGRLCVETFLVECRRKESLPAAFGRLCVETPSGIGRLGIIFQPPSGGCVLKL